MIKKYRKLPAVVEAVQFTRDNFEEISEFTKGAARHFIPPRGINGIAICHIDTLEGCHTATEGDYIIKGIKGEFYPCKPDIFLNTYEECE